MSEHLKAVIVPTANGQRLFINGTEFPWPIDPDIVVGDWLVPGFGGSPSCYAVQVTILVDEVTMRAEHSD